MLTRHAKKYFPIYIATLAFLLALLLFENLFSNSFANCISQYGNSKAAINAKNGSFIVSVAVTQIACTVHFINFHVGFFSIIAGILVAIFTYNLVRSTDALWKAGERQRRDNRRAIFASIYATKAARKSALAAEKSARTAERALHSLEGPIIRPYRMDFHHDAGSGSVSFGFRNYGRSPSVVQRVSAVIIITPANNPTRQMHYITFPFMYQEMIAEKETSEILIVSHDLLRQYGQNIDRAITDLHLMINYSWDSALGEKHGGGTRFIWSPKRKMFLSGIQLWDDPERFPDRNFGMK